MDIIQTFAEELIYAGLSITPVNSNKKSTVSWAEFQNEIVSVDVAEKIFSRAWGVAVIGGKVSGNIECIDFDTHGKEEWKIEINNIFEQFTNEPGVKHILSTHNVYIERSLRGGIHLIYRYENEGKCQGNLKLANWDVENVMIETRGEGGYFVVAPSPGYTPEHGDLLSLSVLEEEQRDYLIEITKRFTKVVLKNADNSETETTAYEYTDPVTWFNWNKANYAKQILKDEGWVYVGFNEHDKVEQWRRPGKSDGVSATWGNKHNALYVFTSSIDYFKQNCYYTAFQILIKLKFSNSYESALKWIEAKYFNAENPYIRVGTDYFKKIKKTDRFGLVQTELKIWKKDEIKQDEKKDFIRSIPKFDDFTIRPDNLNYRPVIENCYNLYKMFPHQPKEGEWKWTEILLRHIFNEQYNLGIRYLQALYLNPKRMLPILVLVSRERQTGKTTFMNWLNMIFGNNMVNINPEDLVSSFNSSYATANIIAVEETLIEKSITVEKLKALATGKFISVNAKFVQQYKVPFFGKIILASNNEDKFARIDEEEIRFFVRKVEKPKIENHNIEEDMINEIPAFLHYLTTLPDIDWRKDRSGFTPDELVNDSLKNVKLESKSSLYKDLHELFYELFIELQCPEMFATPTDIKTRWFDKNSRIDIQYIKHVIKDEFNKIPERPCRYIPFNEPLTGLNQSKTGTPYRFTPDNFKIDFEKFNKDLEPDGKNVKEIDMPF